METYSINWFWILILLVKLTPFEVTLDVPDTDEKLYVSLNLEMKK